VSCSICMDRFNSSKHTPRTLRCNHTFCEWCIRGLGEKQKVTCPKCRQETPVENADVTKLLCNFQLLEVDEAAGAEAAAEADPVCENVRRRTRSDAPLRRVRGVMCATSVQAPQEQGEPQPCAAKLSPISKPRALP
jgi:hypothetical protein